MNILILDATHMAIWMDERMFKRYARLKAQHENVYAVCKELLGTVHNIEVLSVHSSYRLAQCRAKHAMGLCTVETMQTLRDMKHNQQVIADGGTIVCRSAQE